MTDNADWTAFNEKLEKLKSSQSDEITYFQMAEKLAKSLDIFEAVDISNTLKINSYQELILNSGKHSHGGFKEQFYCNVFLPSIEEYPITNIEYWFYCVVKGFRLAGIAEVDTSYCMAEYFKDNNLPYDIPLAILLTKIYKEDLDTLVIDSSLISNPDISNDKTYVLHAFGVDVFEELLI